MTNLQPVDFKAVAAKGAYVYCYLREDGSPYYVGFAGKDRYARPLEDHGSKTPLPKYDALVRVLRSGLTQEMAFAWEIFYIKRYGRKIDGGLLLNRSSGGEASAKGARYSRTPEDVAAKAAQLRGQKRTDKQCLEISERAKVRSDAGQMWYQSNEGRKKVSAQFTGVKQSKEQIEKRIENGRLTQLKNIALRIGIAFDVYLAFTLSQRRQALKWAANNPNSTEEERSLALKHNFSSWVSKRIKRAQEFEIYPETYLSFDEQQRRIVAKRFKRGKRGAALVAGLVAA